MYYLNIILNLLIIINKIIIDILDYKEKLKDEVVVK
jgi:hypothetical protein